MLNTKNLILALGVVLVIALGIYAKSTYLDSQTVLTVSGEGRAKASPELAQFTVTYATSSAAATDALNGEKNFRQKIITLLSDLYEVNQSDMQISYPSIVPSASSSGGIIYQAVNAINVNFKKLTSLDEAIGKLYQINNLSISNLIFTTNNARDLEDEAMKEAVKDGEIRAGKLAQAGGKHLGKLLSVTAQQTQAVGTVSTEAGKAQSGFPGVATAALPGQIQITRNVTLVYQLN